MKLIALAAAIAVLASTSIAGASARSMMHHKMMHGHMMHHKMMMHGHMMHHKMMMHHM